MSTNRPSGSGPEWSPDSGQPPYPGQPSPGQQPDPGAPAPYAGYGSSASQPNPAWPGTSAPAYPGGDAAWRATGPALRRPGSVTTGVVLSWIGAGIFTLLGLFALLFASNAAFLSGVEASVGQPIDQATVTTVMQSVGALMLIWGVGVLLAATFAWRRRNAARIVLSVMAVLYGLFQLVGVASGVVAAIPSLLWVAVAAGLLWTRTARDWFAGRSAALGPSHDDVRPPQPW